MIDLGKSLKFPLTLLNGDVIFSNSRETIEEGLTALLNTPKGATFMLPQYGSKIHELIYEPNNAIVVALLRRYIADAISMWEPRVKFLDVKTSTDGDTILCTVWYRINVTNEVFSLIYPFNTQI